MSQTYNDNTKRPKPKENQLGILGISSREFTHYFGNSADGLRSGRGESPASVTYLSLRIFVYFISVFNLFLFNIGLICWCDNLQSI